MEDWISQRGGRLSRRKFMSMSLGLGVLGWTGAAAQGNELEGLRRFQKSSAALGTHVSLMVYHSDAGEAEAAMRDGLAEVEQVEQVMSLYREGSQIRKLNRFGELEDPHPYLEGVLSYAAEVSKRSGGAFDVTVQPLWELFAQAKKEGRLPSRTEVEEARKAVDWRRVRISDGRIRLEGVGTAVTLNGIAQGFAVDRVHHVLRNRGIRHALIDCGELGAVGGKGAHTPWTVGIRHPRLPEEFVSKIELADRCLATSGDYATSFDPGFRHHHIFDPRTGWSPEELASVSVAASSSMEADALSTAAFVLGSVDGMRMLQSFTGVAALFVLKSGRVVSTPGFPS